MDDDPSVRKSLTRVVASAGSLEDDGHPVSRAQEAIERAVTKDVEDLEMEKMRAGSVAELVRLADRAGVFESAAEPMPRPMGVVLPTGRP